MEEVGTVVLLDARPGAEGYAAGHLCGAIHADLNVTLSRAGERRFDPTEGGRHPLPEPGVWAQQLGDWGVGPESEVVIYDAEDGSNAAARTWWMLRSFGHEAVAVLDGGFRAAAAAGLPVDREPATPTARAAYPADRWQLGTVDLPTVDARRSDPDWTIIDVRSAPRFRGETEPIDPIAGHIPGAINRPFTDNLEAGRWKAPDVLRAQYEPLLRDGDAGRVIVHCGSGVTACHTLLAFDAAGLPIPSLYVGSWSEWCRSDRPRDPQGAPAVTR